MREASGQRLTCAGTINETGYAEPFFDTNLVKGLYSRFLTEISEDTFEVGSTADNSMERFVQLTTQSGQVELRGAAPSDLF